MIEIFNQSFVGERSLFQSNDACIKSCSFADGESALKESKSIKIEDCDFKWYYPVWYCKDVSIENCRFNENTRAAVWYTHNFSIHNTLVAGPKTLRRCSNFKLENVQFPDAPETLWYCTNGELCNVTANGDYFGMNCENLIIYNLNLKGKYSFDGAKNIEMHNSYLDTKDAFWNAQNITVYDSVIIGEYLSWNSENIKFVNCTIESEQAMCYMNNVELINCKTPKTTLAFEYSTVKADITTPIDSVFNPVSGIIKAPKIGELIIEKDKIDETKTKIECEVIEKKSEKPEWL